MKQVHLKIGGLVKGVAFRFSMVDIAEELKVRGWCKNLDTDHIEVVVQGEEDKVKEFIGWCHEGPPKARVDHVEINWETPTSEFDGFTVKY